jgi:hypothetical protein
MRQQNRDMIFLIEILTDSTKDDDDDDEDVLINVNIADNELAKKRTDLGKKKTPGYRAYDDTETADQFGMVRCLLFIHQLNSMFVYFISFYFPHSLLFKFNANKLLEQYDEQKKSSFRLGK